jgi:hypothetical protein
MPGLLREVVNDSISTESHSLQRATEWQCETRHPRLAFRDIRVGRVVSRHLPGSQQPIQARVWQDVEVARQDDRLTPGQALSNDGIHQMKTRG